LVSLGVGTGSAVIRSVGLIASGVAFVVGSARCSTAFAWAGTRTGT
jgi:hypothetical protein